MSCFKNIVLINILIVLIISDYAYSDKRGKYSSFIIINNNSNV